MRYTNRHFTYLLTYLLTLPPLKTWPQYTHVALRESYELSHFTGHIAY